MARNKTTGFSFLRAVALRCAVSIVLIGSLAADEHDSARRIAGEHVGKTTVTELHVAPVVPFSGDALRENAGDIYQRIQESRTEESGRQRSTAFDSNGYCPLCAYHARTFQPISLVWARIQVTQLSFAQAETTQRLPIPPPYTSATI